MPWLKISSLWLLLSKLICLVLTHLLNSRLTTSSSSQRSDRHLKLSKTKVQLLILHPATTQTLLPQSSYLNMWQLHPSSCSSPIPCKYLFFLSHITSNSSSCPIGPTLKMYPESDHFLPLSPPSPLYTPYHGILPGLCQ